MLKNVIETNSSRWCTIPRVASNTISRALENDRVAPPREPKDVAPSGKQTFAVLREPRDRFVSAIAMLQQAGRYRFKVHRPPRSMADYIQFDQNTTPEEVMNLVEAGHMDIHFMPQSDFVVPGATILLYEDDAWKAMLGRPALLNSVVHPTAEEWCKPRTLQRIDDYYAADIALRKTAVASERS